MPPEFAIVDLFAGPGGLAEGFSSVRNNDGLLSSSVEGERVFDQVLHDLSRVGDGSYRLIPLTPRSRQNFFDRIGRPPTLDFVVRAEDHGVPQARHRVIIVGMLADLPRNLSGIPRRPNAVSMSCGISPFHRNQTNSENRLTPEPVSTQPTVQLD